MHLTANKALSALILVAPFVACAGATLDPPTTAGATTTTESSGTGEAVTSSTSTSAQESTSSDTEACSFLLCGSGGSTCHSSPLDPYSLRCSPCDVWAQDCPEGEKCTAWANDGGSSWNATRCVSAGADEPGDPCTFNGPLASGLDTCALGAMCWHINSELQTGTCVELCTGTIDAPLCPESTSCTVSNDGVLNLCLPKCDPVLQDCEPGMMCIASSDGGQCIPEPNILVGVGAPCEYANECEAGLACVNGAELPMCAGRMCCSPYCDQTLPDTCPGAPEVLCLPWYEPDETPQGYEHLGSCSLP